MRVHFSVENDKIFSQTAPVRHCKVVKLERSCDVTSPKGNELMHRVGLVRLLLCLWLIGSSLTIHSVYKIWLSETAYYGQTTFRLEKKNVKVTSTAKNQWIFSDEWDGCSSALALWRTDDRKGNWAVTVLYKCLDTLVLLQSCGKS